MVSKKQEVRVKGSDGSEASLHSQSTDTPVLPPVEYLERLKNLDEDAIKWLMKETSQEAAERRKLDNKKITAIIMGQIFGFIFGISGLTATVLLAHLGDSQTASIVGGTTIVAIVLAFVAGKSKE